MDSSQVAEEPEDCNSSESGWTMYLMSPLHSEVEGGDSKDSNSRYHGYNQNISREYDDDDDSMASDASSGPPHYLMLPTPGKEIASKKKNIVETKEEEKKSKSSKKEHSATSFQGSSNVRKMKT